MFVMGRPGAVQPPRLPACPLGLGHWPHGETRDRSPHYPSGKLGFSGRAAVQRVMPTPRGIAKSVGQTIPELPGMLFGMVSTPCKSSSDLPFGESCHIQQQPESGDSGGP